MELLTGLVGLYLLVGFFIAVGRISNGVMGTRGPLATLIAVTLLWPFI
jgi:hypothetical protein